MSSVVRSLMMSSNKLEAIYFNDRPFKEMKFLCVRIVLLLLLHTKLRHMNMTIEHAYSVSAPMITPENDTHTRSLNYTFTLVLYEDINE